MNYVLLNATDTKGQVVEVIIESGRVVSSKTKGVEHQIVDCAGLHVLPGFVDLHTHLREPGFENSETIETGSISAAAGGYTAVHAMANTYPVADTAGVVEQVLRTGERVGLVHVQPIGAVTVGLAGSQLAELGAMHDSEARVRIFSDDGNCVHDPMLMRRALEYVKGFDGIIAQHAQDPRLTKNSQMNEGEVSSRLGLAGWPALAEESIIARDIMLTELTASRLHVCHVSTRRSAELIREAKARGINITAEVTPHHLLLTEDLAESYDPVYKVNPPLRKADDVKALREALVDGTIDVIATDHAPHPKESKDTDWSSAAFGMVGLEFAYAIAQAVLIDSGASSLERLAAVMSFNASRISGLDNQGRYLEPGSMANLAFVNLGSDWLANAKTHSKSLNNPYAGLQFKGRVVHTIYGGEFSMRDEVVRGVVKNA
jgi:dihydroorotase